VNRIVTDLEPFRSQCTPALKQALCAAYSETKSWEPWSFTEVPDCPQIQSPNIIWVQKETHVLLIRDDPLPDPSSICLSKVHETPLSSPAENPMESVARYQSLLLHVSRIPQ
jgi:hypothetical protein